MTDDKRREDRLRSQLHRLGYSLKKSRAAIWRRHPGGYMIVDAASNFVVRGSWFELELDDVAQFVNG